jgi:hypothetical protein
MLEGIGLANSTKPRISDSWHVARNALAEGAPKSTVARIPSNRTDPSRTIRVESEHLALIQADMYSRHSIALSNDRILSGRRNILAFSAIKL